MTTRATTNLLERARAASEVTGRNNLGALAHETGRTAGLLLGLGASTRQPAPAATVPAAPAPAPAPTSAAADPKTAKTVRTPEGFDLTLYVTKVDHQKALEQAKAQADQRVEEARVAAAAAAQRHRQATDAEKARLQGELDAAQAAVKAAETESARVKQELAVAQDAAKSATGFTPLPTELKPGTMITPAPFPPQVEAALRAIALGGEINANNGLLARLSVLNKPLSWFDFLVLGVECELETRTRRMVNEAISRAIPTLAPKIVTAAIKDGQIEPEWLGNGIRRGLAELKTMAVRAERPEQQRVQPIAEVSEGELPDPDSLPVQEWELVLGQFSRNSLLWSRRAVHHFGVGPDELPHEKIDEALDMLLPRHVTPRERARARTLILRPQERDRAVQRAAEEARNAEPEQPTAPALQAEEVAATGSELPPPPPMPPTTDPATAAVVAEAPAADAEAAK